MKPYYEDSAVTIYHGDCREIMTQLGQFDAIISDPPYAETNLEWDHWPIGWIDACRPHSNCLWCFGSMRMFLDRHADFADWILAQDLVWEKHNGSGSAADRFRRVHENIIQFYQGPWSEIYHMPVFTQDATKRTVRAKQKPAHWREIRSIHYRSEDGGPRLQRSVILAASCHGKALHPTQKPESIVRALIEYSVPPGGVLLSPFAGSGTDLRVAKDCGRRAVGIEADERYCEIAAKRIGQEVLIHA